MSFLIRFDEVELSFGDQKILAGANLSIELGDRVCLIGRNGAGKSSTLKLIAGELEPDAGTIHAPRSLSVSKLDQALASASQQTVRDVVLEGMLEQRRRIDEFHHLSTASSTPDKATLGRLGELERMIDAAGGWSIDVRVDAVVSQLELPAEQRMAELSGGWRRRVALAKAIVARPDLLLLDEPTNHLDISTIEWLEREIGKFPGAVLFVTHDRGFVERLATRIVEIDRGQLLSWPGGYKDFLRRRTAAAEDEKRQNLEFDKKLAEEEAWIRQGVRARESRNEGRVRALEAMRAERAQRIARPRSPRIHINQSNLLSGRKVVELRNVTHCFGTEPLFQPVSLRIMRGERIGIIGNNGVGKSTLLRILLGELVPSAGSVKHGTHLEIGYFDQLRRELDDGRTVAEVIGEGREYINFNGRQKHVVAYLTDFLFSAKRAMTPVTALSGGERNRVILAKLFTKTANLLVLDEPTNDLDVETLEALEQQLRQYEGTLIIVSHDRQFLDNVVTSVLVFEADGAIRRYEGGYSDWLRQRRELAVTDNPVPASERSKAERSDAGTARPKKLSYMLQRELDGLPERIEELEAALARAQALTNEPAFFEQSHEAVRSALDRIAELQRELEGAVERWGDLETRAHRS